MFDSSSIKVEISSWREDQACSLKGLVREMFLRSFCNLVKSAFLEHLMEEDRLIHAFFRSLKMVHKRVGGETEGGRELSRFSILIDENIT